MSTPCPPAPRRLLRLASCAGIALAWCSCRQGAPERAPEAPAAAAQTADDAEPHLRDLLGSWRWSHISDEDGVRRVEIESWTFAQAPTPADGPAFVGRYTRTIDFLAQDGVPFSCNQDLVYQLRATYEVRGVIRGGAVHIAETAVRTAPSPCERGERTLGQYTGALELGPSGLPTLRLSWDGGQQTLTRAPALAAHDTGAPTPVDPAPAAAPSLAGDWDWRGRTEDHDQVRVEYEHWRVDHEPGAADLTATITRTVTVFDQGGAFYPCSGDTYYRYSDRYTVRGRVRGASVQLQEIAVEPGRHPCLHYDERHLDAASGTLLGDHLQLEWRGKRRQVLRRADDGVWVPLDPAAGTR